jgi:hypothetical protein
MKSAQIKVILIIGIIFLAFALAVVGIYYFIELNKNKIEAGESSILNKDKIAGFSVYENTEQKFLLQYPSNWTAYDKDHLYGQDPRSFSGKINSSLGIEEKIAAIIPQVELTSIEFRFLVTKYTLPDSFKNLQSQLPANLNMTTFDAFIFLIKSETRTKDTGAYETTINGAKAYIVEYDLKDSNFYSKTAWIEKGDIFYQFEYKMNRAEISLYKDDAEKVLNSVKLT